VDAQRLGPVQPARGRACPRLVTPAATVLRSSAAALEMMQHATAGEHPAGRYQDAWPVEELSALDSSTFEQDDIGRFQSVEA